jgi:RimJ/RimL family protein N-acetyltransferase
MASIIEIPALRTPRLLLRGFAAADWDAFAVMEADPEVRRYRGGNVLSRAEAWTSMQLVLGQWGLRGYGVFALTETVSGRFAGIAGVLHPADWPEPELAYSLARPFWRQGLASEAAAAARDWAFAAHGFEHLASFILADNAASVRVAARLGATREGTVTLRGFVAQRWVHPRPGTGKNLSRAAGESLPPGA